MDLRCTPAAPPRSTTPQQELSALFGTKLTIDDEPDDDEPDDARYPRLPLMEKPFEGYGHLKDAVVKAYEGSFTKRSGMALVEGVQPSLLIYSV